MFVFFKSVYPILNSISLKFRLIMYYIEQVVNNLNEMILLKLNSLHFLKLIYFTILVLFFHNFYYKVFNIIYKDFKYIKIKNQ